MCQCADRRRAIVSATASALQGNLTSLGSAARLVLRTSAEDVAAMARRMSGAHPPRRRET